MNQSLQETEDLPQRLAREQPHIDALCSQLRAECQRLGFEQAALAIEAPLVNAELRKDTFDGSQSLYAEWRTPAGALLGYVLIHAGGQIYAEYDIIKPHPTRTQWMVEAITAWGTGLEVKAEARLLPAPGE